MPTQKRTQPLILTGIADRTQVNVMYAPLKQLFPRATIVDEGGYGEFCKAALAQLPDLLIYGPWTNAEEANELLRRFPKEERPFKILIALSNAQESSRKLCLDAGADDVITRPIAEATDRILLKSKVETLLTGEYASELPFLSAATPLGSIQLNCQVRIVQLNDHEIKFAAPAMLLKGGSARINLGTLDLTVISNGSEKLGMKSYLVSARIESVARGDWADLRRAILLLAENQAAGAAPAKAKPKA